MFQLTGEFKVEGCWPVRDNVGVATEQSGCSKFSRFRVKDGQEKELLVEFYCL